MRTSKIRVLVVESPALADITTGFRAGERVRDQLHLMDVPCVYKALHSASLLTEFLAEIQADYHYDVLHLSGHGNLDCFAFTDGSRLAWNQLLPAITPFAAKKMVVLSSCQSWGSEQATKLLSEELNALGVDIVPRYVLSYAQAVTFGDDALSFGIFYRHMADKKAPFTPREVHDALTAVKGARFGVKICASVNSGGASHNISPWAGALRPEIENLFR